MRLKIEITILLVILGLIALDGCETIDKLTHFNMDYDETLSIPSTIGINLPFNLFTPNNTADSQEVFEINVHSKFFVDAKILGI